MKALRILYVIFLLLILGNSTFAQNQRLSKNTLAIGIRGYGSLMKALKKTDTSFLRYGIGIYTGYFHNLNKKGNLFAILSIGYDNFWTYKFRNLNSFSLNYDAYFLFRPFMISLTIGERCFIKSKPTTKIRSFEFEFGGGLLYNIGSLFRSPSMSSIDIGLNYRQIGVNKMLYVGFFYALPR